MAQVSDGLGGTTLQHRTRDRYADQTLQVDKNQWLNRSQVEVEVSQYSSPLLSFIDIVNGGTVFVGHSACQSTSVVVCRE